MKVLLVEDSDADARLVREMLRETQRSNVDLVHAWKLGEALNLLRSESFDVVLLDLGLPDVMGLDALAPVQAAVPDIPIVVLSGHNDDTLALQAVQNGAQDYLMKGEGDGALLTRALRYAVERKRTEQHIHHLAHHDGLTNLPNRRLLMDRLEHSLAMMRRANRLLAVVFMDLDHFKPVNDTFGHSVGDQALLEVASRLRACVRESDTVARIGGDEFTVLLPDVSSVDDVQRFANKLMHAISPPMSIGGRQISVSASMGISLFPWDGDNAEVLLRCADAAMYQAKQQGSEAALFYSGSPHQPMPERLHVMQGLRRAVEQDEFVLHYQPRVDAGDWTVCGVETLVRWNHPELGLLYPSRFIPLAEEMGMIVPIGEWVLHHACRQVGEWNGTRPGAPLRLSVNLSSREFGHRRVQSTVERALGDTHFSPRWLELELTEGGLMRNELETSETLRGLHDMGIGIAIDDFGTGYSSLGRLRNFPIDALKIDRSFVRDITSSAGDAAIVAAIITMAHGMGLRVTAEGVEAHDQRTLLTTQGCDEMQGFLFGHPVAPEQLVSSLLETESSVVLN
ncbi:MAG: EAL domain-containing protein [Candidatus Eisenbacteria bacterium]|uniref:EAL domain-containing protein n=1 Tax=Eiseniibacteriota bacterium TaxID=2212470 RepID=A0A538T990_UNCEI|nr:MAG: EAL domain-containing protein [Candidatus Eisenbacteria bacterium]